MMLLLAAHRRALEQDRMVREGRWSEGRPQLLKVPRLMGQTLGFIAFGRVAARRRRRAKAVRPAPDGLSIPFLDELTIAALGVEPASLSEVLANSDFVSMHLPATPEARRLPQGAPLPADEEDRDLHQHRARADGGRGGADQGAAGEVDRRRRPRRVRDRAAEAGQSAAEDANVILSPHNASASARFDPARKRRVGQELALVLCRQMADVLRQSDGAAGKRAAALAAGVDGARAERVG